MSIRCSNISRKERRLMSCSGVNEDVHDLFVFSTMNAIRCNVKS